MSRANPKSAILILSALWKVYVVRQQEYFEVSNLYEKYFDYEDTPLLLKAVWEFI